MDNLLGWRIRDKAAPSLRLGFKAMEDGKAGKASLVLVSILLPTTNCYLHLYLTDAFGVGGSLKTINELSIN